MNTATMIDCRQSQTLISATHAARVALIAAAAGTLFSACGGSGDLVTEAPPAEQVRAAASPPPPVIRQAPQDATIGIGAGVRLSVVAVTLGGRLTYRWYKNGVAIPGAAAAGSNYDIAAAVAGDSGIYTVRVTDSLFQTSATSTLAKLNVVQNQWAQLGGRPVYSVGRAQQPSLALCGSPSVAHVLSGNGRAGLYVKYFDGKQWVPLGNGGTLNQTATGNASTPSLDCVSDGTTYRPIVAWSEGTGVAHDIYVKVWNGSKWDLVGAGALNATPGSDAWRPTLRTTPFDANTGNTFINGATRRSAIAWIENGVPTVKYWDNGWLPYGAGVQIPNVNNASDIALTIELDEQGRTYPPIVAGLATIGGVARQFVATHNAGLGMWVMMANPVLGSLNPPTPAASAQWAGRIGIGVGKYLQGRTPVAFWADHAATTNFHSYMYDSGNFVQGTGGQAWTRYGTAFTVAGMLKTTSFDHREFRREGANACALGNLPTFGWAISRTNGFEVRRGTCGMVNSPADWAVVRTGHHVPLEEISLRMASADDPYVAGTQLTSVVNGVYELSVWKFYP